MLEFIRKHSSSVGVKIFLTVLALTFVFCFGISDIIRKLTGRDYVVKIANLKISPEMFKYEKAKKMNLLRDKSEKIDDAVLTNAVLHSLIWENVINNASKEFGFVISDTTMKSYIRGMALFRDEQGRFNPNLLRGFLQKLRVPEAMFIETSRRDIKSALIQAPIKFVSITPEANVYTAANLEKRTIDYVELKPSTFKITEEPTQDELESFYEEHQDSFVVEETRSMHIVELLESNIEKGIKVSEDEIKDAYDFSSEKDERSYDDMKAELEANLRQEKLQGEINDVTRQIEDALMAGEELKTVAEKFALKMISVENVKLNDKKAVANIPYGEDVLTVAFSIDEGTDSSFSEALNASKNRVLWLVHVDSVTPKHTAEFSKVLDKVKAEYIKEKQHEEARTMAADFVEKLKNGENIKTLASKVGRTCETSVAFDRFGTTQDKKKASEIVSNLYKDVFAKSKNEAAYNEINGNVVVYQVKQVIPAKNITEEDQKKLYAELYKEMKEDIYQQLIGHLSKRYNVTINYEMLKEFNEPTERLDDIF
ncbi:MAG: SurA N-terminal domain-containing protein [Alphaproteobacteria bacterium]|nr:SurA N-terminal domain-containing protein [Alphaproteobacteria bacterium]